MLGSATISIYDHNFSPGIKTTTDQIKILIVLIPVIYIDYKNIVDVKINISKWIKILK